MNRRILPALALPALLLAACGSDAAPAGTSAPVTEPSTAPSRTAEEVAVELSTRMSTVFTRASGPLATAETPEQVAEAGADLLALGDEINAATYPGVTVTMAHPRLPLFVEVSGADGVFCVGDLNALEEITTDDFVLDATEGPCQDVPTREELDELVAAFSGDPDAFASMVENSRVEATRLAAEAAVMNVQALVSFEMGDATVDASVERFWAYAALDFAGFAEIFDGNGDPVEESDDRHDRYQVVQAFGGMECTATVDVAAADGYAEATVSSVSCT